MSYTCIYSSIKTCLFIFVSILLFYSPFLFYLGFVNEDTALLYGVTRSLEDFDLYKYFYSSYGPNVIRPLQLLGMFYEHSLLGLSAKAAHVISVGYLSLSLTVFYFLLKKYFDSSTGVIFCSLIALSMQAAEPLFWLSDRHDLYLFLFFSLALYTSAKYFCEEHKRFIVSITYYFSIFLAFTGALYSNEKAVIIPCVVSAYILLIKLTPSSLITVKRSYKQILFFMFLSTLLLIGYFYLRHIAIGNMIGGYNSKVFPENKTLLDYVYVWPKTLYSAFFRNESEEAYRFSLYLGTLLLLTTFCLYSFTIKTKISLVKNIFVGVFLLLICLGSSLPTLQYNFSGDSIGMSHSRIQWLSYVVCALNLSVFFHFCVRKQTTNFRKGAAAILPFIFIVIISFSGRAAVKAYAFAQNKVDKALSIFNTYCACADVNKVQTSGLPIKAYGAQVFSEPVWLQYAALYEGLPLCEEGEIACKLSFSYDNMGLGLTSVRVSMNDMKSIQRNLRLSSRLKNAVNSLSFDYHINTLQISDSLEDISVKVSGWVGSRNFVGEASLIIKYGSYVVSYYKLNFDEQSMNKEFNYTTSLLSSGDDYIELKRNNSKLRVFLLFEGAGRAILKQRLSFKPSM